MVKHGLTAYIKHRCRCEICKAAKKAAAAKSSLKNRDHIRAKNAAYARANPDTARARVARWIEANPERHRANGRARSQRYADANREAVRARYREWAAANPDKARAADRAYKRANPQKSRDAAKIRRARQLGAEICTITDRDWRRLLQRHGGRCAYCGDGGEIQKDHIIPITRGGRHAIGNLLPACKSCNSSKNNRLLIEWRRRPKPTPPLT